MVHCAGAARKGSDRSLDLPPSPGADRQNTPDKWVRSVSFHLTLDKGMITAIHVRHD